MLTIQELAFGRPVPYFVNHTSEDAARADGMRGLRTGLRDIDALREYVQWMGVRETNTWRGHLEYVAGTDGKQFRRNVPKGGAIKAWEIDIVRQVYLWNVDNKERDVRGVTTLLHRVIERMYQNSTFAPENAVYNMVNTYNGMINISALAVGIPMFVTPARFLWVDPVVTSTIEYEDPSQGEANIDEHASYTCVEAFSGITFDGGKVGQIVIKVGPTLIPEYDTLHVDTYLPIVWFKEGGRANSNQADEFLDGVVAGRDIRNVLLPLFSVLSALTYLGGFYLVFKYVSSNYKYAGDTFDGKGLLNP